MRRLIIWTLVLVTTAFVATPTVAAGGGQQIQFRALYHETLAYRFSTNTGGWQFEPGPVYCLVNGQGRPANVAITTENSRYSGKMGQDHSDVYLTVFLSADDSFVVGDWHATYEYTPGGAGMVTYHGVGRIVGGTGMFAGATGSYTESGPTLTWLDDHDPDLMLGQYDGAAAATIQLAR
jgi:hypothetical protein